MSEVVRRLNLTESYSIHEHLRDRDLYGQSPIDVDFINGDDNQSLSMTVTPPRRTADRNLPVPGRLRLQTGEPLGRDRSVR